ncbi:MAG: class I SAM-dependent methyltransferase [Chloroflexi bacterium]|nr:class I SAM-dependent methyltransferase [Chloroflexota bacterium]
MALELVRDLADRQPTTFHRFLWGHHLAYARFYDVAQRFGAKNIHPTRHLLFADLQAYLRSQGLAPDSDIDSVFEVGCSLGYLLRHLETEVFPTAQRLAGLDIDASAVQSGRSHLRKLGSKVRLIAADMANLEPVLGDERYDLILCAGALLYLEQDVAAQLVATMLRHANVLVAMAGLAHPHVDNAGLTHSAMRTSDCTFIHNLDAMVRDASGTVVFRRWEGARIVDGNTIYFVFATPSP